MAACAARVQGSPSAESHAGGARHAENWGTLDIAGTLLAVALIVLLSAAVWDR
eukprot:gene147-1468_t